MLFFIYKWLIDCLQYQQRPQDIWKFPCEHLFLRKNKKYAGRTFLTKFRFIKYFLKARVTLLILYDIIFYQTSVIIETKNYITLQNKRFFKLIVKGKLY